MLGILSIWISVAGGVGGLVTAVLADNTLGVWPKKKPTQAQGLTDFKSNHWGWLAAVLVYGLLGVVASWLSWALYGPLNGCPLFGHQASTMCQHPEESFTLAVLATAFVVGFAGPRWLATEVDRQILKGATAEAMRKNANDKTADRILSAGATEIRELVRRG